VLKATDQLQRMEVAVECRNSLADVLGQIADPLEIGRNIELTISRRSTAIG
jgi:hypothetical protein